MKKSEIITIFLIVFVFNAFLCVLTLDDVWNFGFSYNIASGLIPYRDFNMVITPFFPMLMAFFLSLFSKHIVIMYIVNSVIVVSIIYLIKKVCKDSYYLLFILILPLSTINYSLFCLFLLLLILYCEMNNKSDYLIGFLLAITILTKQHVGLALLIPSILIFKKECLLKRFIGFIIPILTFILYLISTNSLRPFIDYTVLVLLFHDIIIIGDLNVFIYIW
jgi:hypothetical protein